jgi:hypothetical protein
MSGAVVFAAGFMPCLHNVLAERLLHRQARKESPGLVMAVFMKNRDTAFRHNRANLFDSSETIIHKRNHPAAPEEIVVRPLGNSSCRSPGTMLQTESG